MRNPFRNSRNSEPGNVYYDPIILLCNSLASREILGSTHQPSLYSFGTCAPNVVPLPASLSTDILPSSHITLGYRQSQPCALVLLIATANLLELIKEASSSS